MQWLIDLIKEWVISQGYITCCFTDRGDPATIDFDAADFTKDFTWRDLNLSSIVPASANCIALSVVALTVQVGINVQFRKKDNSNNPNRSRLRTQISYETMPADMIVACDVNRVIQYRIDDATWLNLEVTVKGWWC